jgi:hypothetical protein
MIITDWEYAGNDYDSINNDDLLKLEKLLTKAVRYCFQHRCEGCEIDCPLTDVCYLLYEHGCADNTVLGDLNLENFVKRLLDKGVELD